MPSQHLLYRSREHVSQHRPLEGTTQFFPLKAVWLQDLPPELRASVAERLEISPSVEVCVRPSQATTPMGSKFSVIIAGVTLAFKIRYSYAILRCGAAELHRAPTLAFLSKQHAPLMVSRARPLVCQIMYDAAIILINWLEAKGTQSFQIVRDTLAKMHLSISMRKYSIFSHLVITIIPFIGIYNRPRKLDRYSRNLKIPARCTRHQQAVRQGQSQISHMEENRGNLFMVGIVISPVTHHIFVGIRVSVSPPECKLSACPI